jgi:hypothetical protein
LSPVLREDELQIIGNTPTQKAVVSCCQTGTLEVEIQDEGTFESKELGFTAGSGLRVRQLVLTLFPISIVAIFLLKTQLMQLLVLAIVFVFSLILSISYKRFLHEAKWQSQITLSESVVAKNFEGVQEQTMVKCTINNIGPANMRGSFVHFCWVDETSSIVALQTLYLRIMAGESMEKNLVFTAPIPENATLVLRLAPVSIP